MIEDACNKFLWDVDGDKRKKAWSEIVLPRQEGGLGIKDFKNWNKACVIRHLWNLLAEARGLLWVAWMNRYRIKGRNLWLLSTSSVSSWVWRKILKCRSKAQSLVIGSGAPLFGDGSFGRAVLKLILQDVCAFAEFADWSPQLQWAEQQWVMSSDKAVVGCSRERNSRLHGSSRVGMAIST
ncbi:unnamed protein product [Linum trigynum]|uniref:Uncharacterized protein n=1 Tax=Linum trigynum TaxID=586398 RepID=A0AAV2GU06_9ROSI